MLQFCNCDGSLEWKAAEGIIKQGPGKALGIKEPTNCGYTCGSHESNASHELWPLESGSGNLIPVLSEASAGLLAWLNSFFIGLEHGEKVGWGTFLLRWTVWGDLNCWGSEVTWIIPWYMPILTVTDPGHNHTPCLLPFDPRKVRMTSYSNIPSATLSSCSSDLMPILSKKFWVFTEYLPECQSIDKERFQNYKIPWTIIQFMSLMIYYVVGLSPSSL